MRGAIFFWVAAIATACGGSIAPVEIGANDSGSPTPTPGVPGAKCGTSAPCGPGTYCDFDGACGVGGTPGTCKSVPTGCTDIFQPVCGCDSKTYGNPCSAAGAGVAIAQTGACVDAASPAPIPTIPTPTPPTTGELFACGTLLCVSSTQYCQRTFNDSPPPAETDRCLPLPASCGSTSSCSCFPPSTPCIGSGKCSLIPTAKGPNYGFEIMCPGG